MKIDLRFYNPYLCPTCCARPPFTQRKAFIFANLFCHNAFKRTYRLADVCLGSIAALALDGERVLVVCNFDKVSTINVPLETKELLLSNYNRSSKDICEFEPYEIAVFCV